MMRSSDIYLYPPSCTDFTANGLGRLDPIECRVEERAAGLYEATLVQPIDDTLRWAQIANGCIIKVPVPMRESPLYEAPAQGGETSVTRNIWVVRGTTHGLYIRTGPGMNYRRIGIKHNGDEVMELEDCEDPWKKVCVLKGGQVGYMSTKWMSLARTVTETIAPERPLSGSAVKIGQSREQLFRIYSVERDSAAATVTAKALHVFYDDAGNLIDGECTLEGASPESAMERIRSALVQDAQTHFSAIGLSGEISGDFGNRSPIEAYLDPDTGIVAQTGAMLIRDNWDAYLLPSQIRDRGVTVRRGKNLIGVEVTEDASKIVTRIIPVGKKKNGDPLYLSPTKWVDSPRIGETPVPRVQRVEYDVQTGKGDFKTDAAARAELARLAKADFEEKGADLPAYGMEVDFVLLENTAEYADYASLQAVHLYDSVTVIDEMLGLRAKLWVTGYEWDCLAQQYEKVTLGELQDLQQSVYSYNLPDGGVSGAKIMNNSLPGAAIRSASIEYAKIGTAAVEQLSADAITALTARIREITAQKLTADELYAAYADLIALKAGTITADNISTDALAAELARITVLAAGTATFDKATIRHLVSQAMNLEFGTAGRVFIENLAVEYAQMVGATIGNLCIKASDGNYYKLDVNANGNVTANLATLSSGEIAAGETGDGRVILETNITAANLNAGNLLATYALVNRIDAARIDVDTLFAREAFVNLLRTSRIVGEKSITMIAEEASDAKTVATNAQSTANSASSAAANAQSTANSALASIDAKSIHDGTSSPASPVAGALWLDRSVTPCVLRRYSGSAWETVNDVSLIETVQDAILSKQAEIEAAQRETSTYLRLDNQMLRIGKADVTSEFRIDPWGAGVSVNDAVFSRFEAARVLLGKMEIRTPAVGGLAFDSVADAN